MVDVDRAQPSYRIAWSYFEQGTNKRPDSLVDLTLGLCRYNHQNMTDENLDLVCDLSGLTTTSSAHFPCLYYRLGVVSTPKI